jgi:hypothetical protein
MAIKKRSSEARESSTRASYHDDSSTDARHPFLHGLRQDVYYFVQANPNCTRDDVSRGLSLKSSTATARIKELIDEGFIFEPPGIRKENRSGVRAKVLRVTDRQQGGKPLDRVRIEIELTIDCSGNYGARARVVGGDPTGHPAHVIKKQNVTITAPHPSTYASLFTEGEVVPVSRYELQAHAEDIIEGEAFTVES